MGSLSLSLSFLAKRKFLAKKKFLAKNGEKYAILIDFGNFCYGKIITKKWKLEVKVIISRQFYFEISGIRLEGGDSKLPSTFVGTLTPSHHSKYILSLSLSLSISLWHSLSLSLSIYLSLTSSSSLFFSIFLFLSSL